MPPRGFSGTGGPQGGAPRKRKSAPQREKRKATPAPLSDRASSNAGDVARAREQRRNLRRDVARARAKVKRGKGPRADTGDVTRGTAAPTRAERERSQRAQVVESDHREARALRNLERATGRKIKAPERASEPRTVLGRLLGAAGDAAHALYPRGGDGDGGGKQRTATIGGGLGAPLQPASLPVRVPTNVARAFIEAPGATTKSTAKSLRDIVVGIPGGLVSAATDPVGTVKETAKDYKRRYGPLLEGGGDREFIERIKKEGAAGEILDATVAVSAPGSVAGRATSAAARRGALGPKARRTVTEPRRRVRTSGGKSREQEIAPTYGRAVRQKRRDEAAVRGQQRAADRADTQRKGRATKGPVRVEVREALEAGEVVPSRPTGVRVRQTDSGGRALEISRAPSARKLTKAQQRSYATAKGRALHAMRREQKGEVGDAKRNLASLSKHEAVAFKDALQLGATSPKAARVLIARRLALVERERAKGAEVLDTDEAPVLRALLDAPDRAFTAKLARVVDAERARGRRVAAGDPGVAESQALLRVTKPQAEALGIERAGTPIRAAQAQARSSTRTAKAARARAGRQVEVRTRKAARERGRTELLVRQAAGRDLTNAKLLDKQALALDDQAARLHKLSRKNMMGKRATDPLADVGVLTDAQRRYRHKARRTGVRRQGVQVGSQGYRTGQRQARRAQEIKQLAESLRSEAKAIRATKAGEQTKPVQALSRLERAQARVLEAERARDTARGAVKQSKAAQRDLSARRGRGQELVDAEPVEAYVARTSAAAEASGAQSPGYFPSRKREQVRYSSFAAGGAKAVQPDKSYTGKLFREGREDASQTTYLQGVAQNIKRKHNWNLIADTFDAHTVPWGRDKTIGQLEDELVRRGVDPDSIAFWNAGRYRRARSEWEKTDGGFDERAAGEEPVAAGVGEAVRQASIDGRGLATVPDAFRSTRGWSIVPKALFDEVHADTKPSGAFGRSLDVVKGKQARIMLGLSPAWLQFQVASNGLLAGLAGTGPLDMLKANLVWWRRLSDDEKAAVEPYVGVGAFADSYEQTRLGASSNLAIVNTYRAFKAHDFWHKPRAGGKSVRDRNPLDVLFRIDNAQNNAFRRAVLYSQVKRDAYKRMGGRVRAVQRDQDGLARILTLGPEDAMQAVLRDPAALERHARHVNGFLGDYVAYTAKERRWLQRNVMFYGFLRHSLRLTFYTLPAKHPLIASVVGQLGRMQTEEVRRLLGGDELPWALGKFYTVKGGRLKSVDVKRGNPALNTLTELRGPSSFVSLAPPLFAALANQAYAKSSFRQRPFRVKGETQGRKDSEYSADDRLRIFLEEMFTLAAPYRAVKKATSPGPEGDDSSLLLGRRPTKYKRADIVAGIKRDQERRPGSVSERLLLEMAPLVPRDDNSPELAAAIRQRNGQRSGSGSTVNPNPILEARAKRIAASRRTSGQQSILAARAARLAASR